MAAMGLIETSVRGRALAAVYDGMEDCLIEGPGMADQAGLGRVMRCVPRRLDGKLER